MTRLGARAALLMLGLAAPLEAQTGAQALEQGIAAYRRLELDQAAALFTRALEQSDLSGEARQQAVAYLGATEVERGRSNEAARLFRELILLAPDHRLDPLTFSTNVRRVFDGVRETTKAIALSAPASVTLRAAADAYLVSLTPSSPHLVTVVLLSAAGAPVRTLHEGPITERMTIPWDGRVADGVRADPGAYTLLVSSSVEPGTVLRHVRLPLTVQHQAVDTLPTPAALDSGAFRPERLPGDGLLPVAASLAASAATVVLPSVFGTEGRGPARFVVGGAIGIAGIIGFVTGRRGEPLPANIAANQAVRDAWRQEVDRVAATNRERRGAPPLLIRAGAAERHEGDWR